MGQFSFKFPKKWRRFGLGGPRLPGGQRWRESKRLLGWAMEPCGGTGARSVGMVSANEWAGFFEKSGSGTVSTGNRWWCHGTGVPPAVPAPMWRSGGDVMHAPGRDVMHWYSINVVAAKCFFETIFFANQFTIFRIFKDSNFKRKFWTYYFFNNPTFRTVQIGLYLFRRSCPPLGPRAASS